MGNHGAGLGVRRRPGIELPGPCIGHTLGKGVGSCANEGTVTLFTIVEASDGGPMPVIVTVCPSHVSGARLYLKSVGQGDEIETYATSTFAENFEVVRRSGIEPWRLTAAG